MKRIPAASIYHLVHSMHECQIAIAARLHRWQGNRATATLTAQNSQQRRRTPVSSHPSCPGPGVFPRAPPASSARSAHGVGVEVAQCARPTPVIRGSLRGVTLGVLPSGEASCGRRCRCHCRSCTRVSLDVAGPWSAVRVRPATRSTVDITELHFFSTGK